ncbi:MAG: hypothetical protein NTW28_01045 [Candidatus Solibacter sp.]|nr:hypothetical protein [Candidatus Solibacter sp.]
MQTAIVMPVLAVLTLAVHSAAAGDWNSLGRVPKNRNVNVYLKSGQKLTGTILEVGNEGLQLVPQDGRIQLAAGDLTKPVEKSQLGQVVQAATRSGLTLTGTLRQADGRSIELTETNAVQIGRAEIRRVTSRSHGRGALIGLAIGAGGGVALAGVGAVVSGTDKNTVHKGESAGVFAFEAATVFGIIGAFFGATNGKEMTIYNSAPPNQKGLPPAGFSPGAMARQTTYGLR